MAEKLPSYIESLKVDSASESQHSLPYDRQETGVTFDQEIPNELASNQDLSPDGGIRAWLAVFAQVQVYLIEIITDGLWIVVPHWLHSLRKLFLKFSPLL
jgi:hypothetical protein